MISIERLSLSLPAGFEMRASNIAHELTHALAQLVPATSHTLAQLRIPRIIVTAGASDAAIARDIVAAIGRSISASGGRT